MKPSYLNIFLISTMLYSSAWANTISTNEDLINHCYHWIKEDQGNLKYLTKKYQDATKLGGAFSFELQGSGNVRGAGIYCAKTPLGSSGYGDRVVRLNLVSDVVLFNEMSNTCTVGGIRQPVNVCSEKSPDIIAYNRPGADAWYVIKNPKAVQSWTSNDDTLKRDLIENGFTNQAVLTYMENERKTIGIKFFQNTNARFGLKELLADSAKLNSTPIASVMMSLAGYQRSGNTEIPKSIVNSHLAQYTQKLLTSSSVSVGEIENLSKTFPELNLNTLAKSSLPSLNPAKALALNDKLGMNLSSDNLINLWRTVLNSPKSLQELDLDALPRRGDTVTAFNKVMQKDAAQLMGKISGKGAEKVLLLLNSMIVTGDSQITSLATSLVKGLLKDSDGVDIPALYAKIDSKELKKDQIFAAPILETALQSKDGDPVSIVTSLQVVKNDLSPSQKQSLAANLEKMPLKMNSQSSYQIFQLYKDGRISSELLPEITFLPKLFGRALAEQDAGKTDTNVYRLLLSDYYGYLSAKVNNGTLTNAEIIFDKIYKGLMKQDRNEYAMTALQNYSAFHYKTNKWQQALISFVKDPKNYTTDSEYQANIDTLVRSLDGDLMNTLIGYSTQTDNLEIARISKYLTSLTLNYLKSPDFVRDQAKSTFLASQKEKAAWQNFGASARYDSDICYFAKVIEASKSTLSKNFQDEANGVFDIVDSIKNDYCAGQLKN